jgi:hypothetical protein
MNKLEAQAILNKELEAFRAKPYSELIQIIDKQIAYEVPAQGTRYQVEIQAMWDDRPDGDVRIMGSIDDGGWRALAPISRDFIKTKNNQLVDE